MRKEATRCASSAAPRAHGDQGVVCTQGRKRPNFLGQTQQTVWAKRWHRYPKEGPTAAAIVKPDLNTNGGRVICDSVERLSLQRPTLAW